MDPVANMIISLKNAAHAGKDVVSVPFSGLKYAIAEKLKERGYVTEIAKRGKKTHKTIELTFARTSDGGYRFSEVRRVSKPGRRMYAAARELANVRGGTGTLFVSTPKGVLLGDEARKENVGGELLFEIW